jgi:hypothetical protein
MRLFLAKKAKTTGGESPLNIEFLARFLALLNQLRLFCLSPKHSRMGRELLKREKKLLLNKGENLKGHLGVPLPRPACRPGRAAILLAQLPIALSGARA